MEVKEAIEYLKLCKLEDISSNGKDYISIIILIQELSKYWHMWEKFKDEYGFAHYVNQDCQQPNTLKEFMNIIEQKHFPKEE